MWIKFTFMGDVGFLRRALKWLKFQKQTTVGTQVAVSCFRERFVFLIDRYSPQVSRWSMNFGKLIFRLMLRWRDCVVRGFKTPVSLGSTALFVSLWSCFLILTSTACLVYVLLSLGAAVAFVTIFGHTTELFIVGLFGLLILWKYSNLWTSVILLIVGGVMFSLRNALFLVLTSATYALYCVHNRVGWTGDLLVLSFSFISNDLLNKLLLRYDCTCEGEKLEEKKTSEPILEDFHDYFKYFPSTVETCYADSSNSPVNASVTSDSLHVQNDTSCSKAVRTDLVSREEIKRIMNSSSHYDALGFAQRSNIDQIALKKEYYKKAMLVHPDKNMGNPLASESFKKLQGAFEVLSDFTKKKNYDEQLRKEEASRVAQRSCGASRQNGFDLHSDESRRIDCTKCGNSHIWICVIRSKTSARWCQDCSQFHQAKDGDGWVEYQASSLFSMTKKVEIPRAFVCAESKIFDVSEWAICQGVICKPNTHKPSFHVNMVGLDKSAQRSNSSHYPWGLDAEMLPEDDEFELWLQQALASGFFSGSPKVRKTWSPFKMPRKGIKSWRRSP